MLTAAIVGACCVVVGAVLITSAARSAALVVPVSVGPGGMLVFNPANGTAHQDTTGLSLWDSKIRSMRATFTHKLATEHQSRGVMAVMQPCNGSTALTGL
jgi:hypothetical protein